MNTLPHRYAESVSVNLSTSYALLTVGTVRTNGAAPVADACWLSMAQIKLDTIVTAVSVTWYLSEDAAGDIPITPAKTSTIVGQTSGKGGVSDSLERASRTPTSDTVEGLIYVWAKLNAGTANGVARVRFEEVAL